MANNTTTVASLTAKLADTSLLDLVFVIDATGSMGAHATRICPTITSHFTTTGSYIAAAQRTIADIVQSIVAAEKASCSFALVSYRDHPPQARGHAPCIASSLSCVQDSSYVVRTEEFTTSVTTMRKNLDKLSANGGMCHVAECCPR